MRLCVYAIDVIPDVATARRVDDLRDLDDAAITKVLMHERKQRPGSRDTLRWDQLAVAGLSIVRHTPDNLAIESMNLATHAEEAMLRALFAAVSDCDHALSWSGQGATLSMLRFRALLHRLTLPPAWADVDGSGDPWRDLDTLIAGLSNDVPSLDALAIKLGFPGMLQYSGFDAVSAWLNDALDEVQRAGELRAINSYLVALRLFAARGIITRYDNDRFEGNLRELLDDRKSDHFGRFLAAWRDA